MRTDDVRALDVRKLPRQRLLIPGNSLTWTWTCNGAATGTIRLMVASDRVTLDYRRSEHGGGWQAMNYPVRLAWTGCNFGGRRVWWVCPAAGCSRRVAVLFGGAVFACRHCHGLAYRSQREADHDRASRRADKLRDRLGWEPGILNGSGIKPKGMHWRTFDRLQAEHDAHVTLSLAGIVAKLGMLPDMGDDMVDRLGGIG